MLPKRFMLCLVLVAFALSGCAMLQAKTAQDRYDEALASWNSIMKEYRLQRSLQTPEVRTRWDKRFTYPLYETGLALAAWQETLDDATKEQAFIALKNQAIQLLLKHGIIEIKE